MSKDSEADDIDADAVQQGIHRLSRHLHRSGVKFLPTAIPEQVEQWQSAMTVAESAEPRQDEDSPAPSSPPSSSTADHHPVEPSPATNRLSPVASVEATSNPYPGTALPVVERQQHLSGLAEQVAACTLCPKLVASRTQTVFGEGSVEARFAFFGEGPGADEDRSGRPFIGKAGQLLTKMIEACHLRREDTYILNTVKCRPPGNRNPEPDEVDHCRAYFEAQLACVRPEYIICLGAVASQALLKSKLSVGRLRQKFHRYHDSKVLVIYHPAYLLRNPSAKKAAWADLQLLMKDAGL